MSVAVTEPETAVPSPESPYARVVVPVLGMRDATDAHRVRNRLMRMEGVVAATVATDLDSVALSLDPARVTLREIAAELDAIDFALADALVPLSIRGMTSSACVARVRTALEHVEGVVEAQVNPVLNRADVRILAQNINVEALMHAVRRAGYGVTPLGEHGAVADVESAAIYGAGAGANRFESLLLGIVWVLTVPLLLNLAWRVAGTPLFGPFWAFLFATLVLGLGGARYAMGAWRAIAGHAATMDLLVVLGSASAYLYSLIAWVAVGPEGRNLYFETAAAIIAFVRLGKWLEAVVKHGTTRAIRGLMELRAKSARVIKDGALISKPIDKVAIGDVVMVKPYERIPVDGVIVKGESTVDASMITGAGLPEDKGEGDVVTGGTMNGGGVLHVRAARVAADSTLAQIISLVEEAQARKVPLQRFVDRVTTTFIPVVLGLAVFTLFGWLALENSFSEAIRAAVSVLVIACPCALGLAAPAALVAGTGAAARAGILIRDIDSLEKAAGVDTVLFDKTGTLSEGRPFVVSVEALDGDVTRLLTLAASAQQGSEHPLGRAILQHAETYGIVPSSLKSFEAIPGRGVRAVLEGQTEVVIGNRPLMDAAGIDMAVGEWIAPLLSMQGRSAIWLAADGVLVGGISVSDPLRGDARRAVATLTAQGVACAVVSGDSATAVAAAAESLGVKNAFSDAVPQTKVRIVRRLQAKGRSVAMVGDGINDAPALAEADLGIAVGTAADAAMQSADITLLRPDVMSVANALSVARETWKKIRQNLALAFVYNIVALPVAAFGFLSPTVAGAAMALSSVSVVGNAFLLTRWRPRLADAPTRSWHFSRRKSGQA